MGNFCTYCGTPTAEQVASKFTGLCDRAGNYIDIEQIAGLYLSVGEITGYFKKNTDYSPAEIAEIADYIYNCVDGYEYSYWKSVWEKNKLEVAAHPEKTAWNRPVTQERILPQSPVEKTVQAKPLTKHQRIRENKRNGVACCPKCGSTSISSNKKGFSFFKGAIGGGIGSIAPPVGIVMGLGAGNIGSKKLIVTCLNCGHRWKL